jgi:ABC-2 type transport system ATP-binding protein
MKAIDVNNLKKTFKPGLFSKTKAIEALKGISFNINEGEIFGLLGPNGAGKTTTINILSGILKEDSGNVTYFGKPLSEEIKHIINVSSAYSWLTSELTVVQNLRIYGKIYNVKELDRKIESLIKQFGIYDIRNRKILTMSSGQKTRANLCKGLINDPKILLLDEATIGLDPDIAHEIRNIIKNLKTTILFTSHNMEEVEELCGRVAFLSKGTILKMDTPQNLTRLIKEQIVVIHFYPSENSIELALNKLKANIISIKEGEVMLNVDNTKDELHNLLHPILRRGFKIKDLSIKKPKLNDVFIKIARGEIK